MNNNKDELKGRFTAWLEVVVKRAKIDYIRKLNRQPKFVPLDSISEEELCFNYSYKSSNESAGNFEFDNDKVSIAFNALSLRRRKILTLMFVQGKTAEQVAAILGCSAKSVFNEKSIALKQLRESIREN